MKMMEIFESDNLYTKYFQRRSYTDSDDSEKGSTEEVSQASISASLDESGTAAAAHVPRIVPPPLGGHDSTDNFRARLDTLKRKSLPLYDVVVNAVSIVFRFVGIVFSIIVAIDYDRKGYRDYMVYTIMCLVIPTLMTSFISIELHNRETERRRIKALRGKTPTPTPTINGGKTAGGGGATAGVGQRRSTIDAALLSAESPVSSGCFNFCLGVIIVPYLFRYWLSFWYSLKCYLAQEAGEHQKQRYYYKLMIQQDSDVTFLRLFDTFIEVAPQKVLQIGIYLAGKEEMGMLQAILIASCFISMAWSIGSYHRCLRLAHPGKNNMKWTGLLCHLLFNFFLSVSRTLSMALVASIFPLWTLIAVIVHILFMGNFIYIFDKPYFCAYNCCTNYFFSIMLGTVFLFHFIATKDGPQKFKISFFYIVCGLENVACSVVFYWFVDKVTNRFWQLYLIVVWICFFCGLAFKVIYYRWFHPNITARDKSPEKNKKLRPLVGSIVKHPIGNFSAVVHPENGKTEPRKFEPEDVLSEKQKEVLGAVTNEGVVVLNEDGEYANGAMEEATKIEDAEKR